MMNIQLISITDNPEELIERAARVCYGTQDRTGSNDHFLEKILIDKHLSVLEHASATFHVSGVSRALLAQITRHRLASFSVRSQRYCDESEFEFIMPEKYDEMYSEVAEVLRDVYKDLIKKYGMKPEDARSILPMNTATEFVMSANFREWLHVFELRIDRHAQAEIRSMCERMKETLQIYAPRIFK